MSRYTAVGLTHRYEKVTTIMSGDRVGGVEIQITDGYYTYLYIIKPDTDKQLSIECLTDPERSEYMRGTVLE